MALGQFKTGFIIAFAVMFSVVQLICACLPAATAMSASAPSLHMAQMSAGETHSHRMTEMPPAGDDTPHVHENACSHCDDIVVVASGLNLAAPVATRALDGQVWAIRPAAASPYRADMAGLDFAKLRWRSPPPSHSHPSPVRLKTRSLT